VKVPTPRAPAHIPRLGSAVLLHGFTRAPRHLHLLSTRLTREGIATVRPALSAFSWSYSNNNAGYLTTLAERLARGLPEGPVVVVGHSAGAAAGAWVAAELGDRGVDVRRLVMVDGVESPSGLIARSWPRLHLQIRVLLAPASRCNRHGELANWLLTHERDVETLLVPGSGHGDIEGTDPTIYRWACGDQSSEDVRRLVMDTVVAWVREGLTGPR
jgi:pimeloyl-ACP methyl ester carboxylesterase